MLTQGCVGEDTPTVFPEREVRFDAPVTGRDGRSVGRWAELLNEVGGVECDVVAKDEYIVGKYVRQ